MWNLRHKLLHDEAKLKHTCTYLYLCPHIGMLTIRNTRMHVLIKYFKSVHGVMLPEL